jgi:hypothetical protein
VPIEVACDESGYEGEKLIGSLTDVFAHGSVLMDEAAAARCVAELRARIRSPATEYKANHLQREKHRPVLEWFLGPSAPVLGRSRVYLVDKGYFVLVRLTDVLLGESDAALTLYRAVRQASDPAPWQAFLAAANGLLRVKNGPAEPIGVFVDALDALPVAAGPLVRALREARPRAEAYRRGLPAALPGLDLLFPAIARAVDAVGAAAVTAGPGGVTAGPVAVTVVHDRQKTLSRERVAVLTARLGGRLGELRLVGSEREPRVQLADIVAGTVRKIAEDELAGRGDPALTALLRPYVDPLSVWGDERSWARLAPATAPFGAWARDPWWAGGSADASPGAPPPAPPAAPAAVRPSPGR